MQFQFSRSFSLTFVSILNYQRSRHGPKDDHSWQGILTPYYMKTPHRLPIPLFTPSLTRHHQLPPQLLFFVSFLWLNGLSRHCWCVILLERNYRSTHVEPWYLSIRRILQQGVKFTKVWHIICFLCWYSDLISHTHTKKGTQNIQTLIEWHTHIT